MGGPRNILSPLKWWSMRFMSIYVSQYLLLHYLWRLRKSAENREKQSGNLLGCISCCHSLLTWGSEQRAVFWGSVGCFEIPPLSGWPLIWMPPPALSKWLHGGNPPEKATIFFTIADCLFRLCLDTDTK